MVISQKGLHTPHAFAATTILIAEGIRNQRSLEIVNITVANISAVVRLSATGERKNARNHTIQNNCLYVYPLCTSSCLITENTLLSISTSIKVIATSRKKNTSEISKISFLVSSFNIFVSRPFTTK